MRRTTATCALLLLAASAARGADATFTASTGNWSDPASWLNGLLPPDDLTTHIIFNPALPGPFASTVDPARTSWTLNGLTVGPAVSGTSTLAIAPGTTLAFAGDNPFIESPGTPLTITGAITSTTSLTLRAPPGPVVAYYTTINAAIDAPGLRLTGGLYALGGANTLPNGITIVGGSSELRLLTPASLGNAPLTADLTAAPNQGAFVELGATGNATYYTSPVILNASPTFSGQLYLGEANFGVQRDYYLPSLTATGLATVAGPSPSVIHFQTASLAGPTTFRGNVELSNVSGAGSVNVAGGTVTLGTANTYTGGTVARAYGLVILNVPGALGSGPVTLSGGTIALNVPGAITGAAVLDPANPAGTILYNANGAAGGHLLTATDVELGAGITDLAGDSFSIPANGYLSGNSTALGLLTVGTNLTLASGVTIENTSGALPPIAGLGKTPLYLLALSPSSPATVAIGTNTPWTGLAAGKTGPFIGTVTIGGNVSLNGGVFGNGAAASFNILGSSATQFLNVTGPGSTLNSPQSNYDAVAEFQVSGTLTLASADALGGGGPKAHRAIVRVFSGGTLVVDDPAALNGNVRFSGGSTLTIGAAGLTGSGTFLVQGPMTIDVRNPAAFTGSQLTPAFVTASDTVLLSFNDIVNLPSLRASAVYQLGPSFTLATQAYGLSLNNGTLQMQFAQVLRPAATGDNVVHVGDFGATLGVLGSYHPIPGTTAEAYIADTIVATGTLTIGSWDTTTQYHGMVALSGANTLPAVDVVNGGLSVAGPAALGAGAVTLDHATLQLMPLLPASPGPAIYANTFTVVGDSYLSDAPDSAFSVPAFHQPLAAALTLGAINLGAALTTDLRTPAVHFTNLHLTADATLSGARRSQTLFIDALSQDTAHLLTLKGEAGVSGVTFDLASLAAFTGSLAVTNATLVLHGAPSAAALSVAADGTLLFAADADFTAGATLSGAGLVIIEPGSTLTLPIDSAFAGTIEVDGTLMLAAPLNPANANASPAFTLLPTPTPEPASAACLTLSLPALLRRRRKTTE